MVFGSHSLSKNAYDLQFQKSLHCTVQPTHRVMTKLSETWTHIFVYSVYTVHIYIEGSAFQAQYSIATVVAPPAKCRDGKIPDVIQEQRVSYTVARMYIKPPHEPPPPMYTPLQRSPRVFTHADCP